jgi:transposase, IS30 family
MRYNHLTSLERDQVYVLGVINKFSIEKIAEEMNRSPSTISRELRRNSFDDKLYLPDKGPIFVVKAFCVSGIVGIHSFSSA